MMYLDILFLFWLFIPRSKTKTGTTVIISVHWLRPEEEVQDWSLISISIYYLQNRCKRLKENLSKYLLHVEFQKYLGKLLLQIFTATFVSFIPFFWFWFLVTFGGEVTKLQKYYLIFAYIFQGKKDKTEKTGKKITQLKWTKYQKPKDKNMGWTKQIKIYFLNLT